MPFRRNRSLLQSHIESGVAIRTSRYGPNDGCEVSTVREAIHTQPTGIPIHRNTLPSAIRSTSRTAIGLLAIVRKTDGRSRSTRVVAGTSQRLAGELARSRAAGGTIPSGEAYPAGSTDAFQAHARSRGSGSRGRRRCRGGRGRARGRRARLQLG